MKSEDKEALLKHFESIQNNFNTQDYETLHPNIQDGTHSMTGSRYEIVFNINANLLINTADAEQEQIDTKSEKIYNNNYYIPVPEEADKDEYVNNLLNFFQNKLAEATQEVNKEIENNE